MRQINLRSGYPILIFFVGRIYFSLISVGFPPINKYGIIFQLAKYIILQDHNYYEDIPYISYIYFILRKRYTIKQLCLQLLRMTSKIISHTGLKKKITQEAVLKQIYHNSLGGHWARTREMSGGHYRGWRRARHAPAAPDPPFRCPPLAPNKPSELTLKWICYARRRL